MPWTFVSPPPELRRTVPPLIRSTTGAIVLSLVATKAEVFQLPGPFLLMSIVPVLLSVIAPLVFITSVAFVTLIDAAGGRGAGRVNDFQRRVDRVRAVDDVERALEADLPAEREGLRAVDRVAVRGGAVERDAVDQRGQVEVDGLRRCGGEEIGGLELRIGDVAAGPVRRIVPVSAGGT